MHCKCTRKCIGIIEQGGAKCRQFYNYCRKRASKIKNDYDYYHVGYKPIGNYEMKEGYCQHC